MMASRGAGGSREALSDSQSQLLLDLPKGVFALTNGTQLILYTNQGVTDLLGYSPNELVGRPLVQLFDPSSGEDLSHMIAEQAPGGPAVTAELRGMRKDGRGVPLQVVIRTIGAKGQEVTGVYLRDLTEREELAEALASRAAELARSNRELEQFTFIASHDLQEPLRMVGSYTQLLHRRYGSTLDADAKEFLRFAEEGATRMRQLIDDLLAYSRLGTRSESFRRVSMDKILAQALANLRESIRESDAVVTPGVLPELDGDPSQLAQLFQNLIGNALKFRASAAPHVGISAERRGPDWMFSVSDDGIGIPPEYQDRIFVIFQRLHTREEYPGTGIGLAVCKKVVERHGGRIWVESAGQPGKGTTFFFTLPVEQKSGPPVPPKAPDVKDDQLKVRALSMIEERLRNLI